MKTKLIGQSKLSGHINVIYPHYCLESVHSGKPHMSQTQQTPLQLSFSQFVTSGTALGFLLSAFGEQAQSSSCPF